MGDDTFQHHVSVATQCLDQGGQTLGLVGHKGLRGARAGAERQSALVTKAGSTKKIHVHHANKEGMCPNV